MENKMQDSKREEIARIRKEEEEKRRKENEERIAREQEEAKKRKEQEKALEKVMKLQSDYPNDLIAKQRRDKLESLTNQSKDNE